MLVAVWCGRERHLFRAVTPNWTKKFVFREASPEFMDRALSIEQKL
jgi:hypothetical protein